METTGIVAIATGIGIVLGALVTAWINLRKTDYEIEKDKSIREIQTYKEYADSLILRLQQADEARETLLSQIMRERDQAVKELTATLADLASAIERLRHYEHVLKRHNEQIKPWRPHGLRDSKHLLEIIDAGENH